MELLSAGSLAELHTHHPVCCFAVSVIVHLFIKMSMELLKWGLVSLVVATCNVLGMKEPYCKSTPSANETLGFPEIPANIDFVCERSHVTLHCCMRGFSRIDWFEQRPHDKKWYPLYQRTDRYLDEFNQTFVITDASMMRDATVFSCVGKGWSDEGAELRHNITLHMPECHRTVETEFIYPMKDVTNITVETGSDTRLDCFVRFEPNSCTSGCHMFWHRLKESARPQTFSEDGRIYERKDKVESGVDKSVLFIENVEEDDYEWQYYCGATHTRASRVFHLSKPELDSLHISNATVGGPVEISESELDLLHISTPAARGMAEINKPGIDLLNISKPTIEEPVGVIDNIPEEIHLKVWALPVTTIALTVLGVGIIVAAKRRTARHSIGDDNNGQIETSEECIQSSVDSASATSFGEEGKDLMRTLVNGIAYANIHNEEKKEPSYSEEPLYFEIAE